MFFYNYRDGMVKTLVILGILLAIAVVAVLFLPSIENMGSSDISATENYEYDVEDPEESDEYETYEEHDEYDYREHNYREYEDAEYSRWDEDEPEDVLADMTGREKAEWVYSNFLEENMELTDSSSLYSVGYSPEFEMLAVEFRNSGEVYVYEYVPKRVYDALWDADSMGNYFYYNIRDSYDYWRIDD